MLSRERYALPCQLSPCHRIHAYSIPLLAAMRLTLFCPAFMFPQWITDILSVTRHSVSRSKRSPANFGKAKPSHVPPRKRSAI